MQIDREINVSDFRRKVQEKPAKKGVPLCQ